MFVSKWREEALKSKEQIQELQERLRETEKKAYKAEYEAAPEFKITPESNGLYALKRKSLGVRYAFIGLSPYTWDYLLIDSFKSIEDAKKRIEHLRQEVVEVE